ncbi:hypothetical protein D6D19_10689 [Aureobasidium pullulans]|uniref:Uncharacterized protein n=1 Tax=Aureobasidium pullulans TaxID=5580 RepID=A0A4S8YL80_AURPU|nr:hypothetical protein D6D19_10689 [Aureobasidium pullulans]
MLAGQSPVYHAANDQQDLSTLKIQNSHTEPLSLAGPTSKPFVVVSSPKRSTIKNIPPKPGKNNKQR